MAETPGDAVQLYLAQMSDHPLLTRREELEAAARIAQSRRRLRRALFNSNYVLRAAVGILERVARGRMRVDMICEGTFSTDKQRRRLQAIIAPNLRTLGELLRRNRRDFAEPFLSKAAAATTPTDPQASRAASGQGDPARRGIARPARTPSIGLAPARGRFPAGWTPSRASWPGRPLRTMPSDKPNSARKCGG